MTMSSTLFLREHSESAVCFYFYFLFFMRRCTETLRSYVHHFQVDLENKQISAFLKHFLIKYFTNYTQGGFYFNSMRELKRVRMQMVSSPGQTLLTNLCK